VKATFVVPILYAEADLDATLGGLAVLPPGIELERLIVVDVPDRVREPQAREANDRVASRTGSRVIYRLGQRGFGSALRAGFAEATGDVVIPLMGDRSDDVAAIPRMLDRIEAGWDVVGGSRYLPGGAVVGNTVKQRLSRLYSWLVRTAGGPPIGDVTNSFKAYRTGVVRSVATVATSFDVSVELTVKAAEAGYRITEVPAVWTNRATGRSNWHLRREVRNYGRWLLRVVRRRRGRASAVVVA
jgi:glycosyltransferase involved in cell wall biosynthesis